MKIRGTKTFIVKLEASKKKLAKERDALRDLISEYEDIAESADSAIQDIENAIDTLSQYV